ncbi:redoxin domain-containing protein [Halorientalis litorea]|jgi:peroxiredoxin|uniref:redoxin domain-containing protein n=1 Tax=Halorientalis litorea TaxID=2931977 RepID=UPI001FF4490C|nr:redoxin domain-containing protein [Halorientalis litorea]
MTESAGLAVGDTVPDFDGELVFPTGNSEQVPLSDLLTDGPVLLNFYTADFSPDCVNEWCEFRDFEWFTSSGDVQVVGVSKSGASLHRRFIDYLDLGFPLYTDPDLAIAEAFGVRYRAFKFSARARRSTFLVDEDRTVRYKWVSDHWLDPSRDTPPVGEIHEAVRAELDDQQETFGFS